MPGMTKKLEEKVMKVKVNQVPRLNRVLVLGIGHAPAGIYLRHSAKHRLFVNAHQRRRNI